MYLVHATLNAPPAGGGPLAPGLAASIRALAGPDQVEHVVVHPDAEPAPVVGVFLVADRLADAERRTAALVRRAVDELPELRGWDFGPAEVPLIAPFHERTLAQACPAGRNCPGPVPSS
ncbi:hypothetical protein ACGFX4_20360 [Kitasatospora sp. NPDC048365]|uniref:hypothetical protein n=1 Tax=Kitasatospora sp. NPDC048365 TaxID=3364050 RepID=UPI00371DFAA5